MIVVDFTILHSNLETQLADQQVGPFKVDGWS